MPWFSQAAVLETSSHFIVFVKGILHTERDSKALPLVFHSAELFGVLQDIVSVSCSFRPRGKALILLVVLVVDI